MNATIEAKYAYPLARHDHLRSAISAACLRDPRFAEDDVHSVYFDTPSLALLHQKESSDYLKTKIRIRWYGRSARSADGLEVAAFLERKSKQGTFRRKPRIELRLPLAWLREGRESFDDIARVASGPLAELAPDLGALFPMIVVRYRRSRFVEPSTGARISLDGRIRFSSVNGRLFAAGAPRMLGHGVLEVKSADGTLPGPLRAARYFLFARDAFSKYEECWRGHRDPFHRRGFRWNHFEK